jgi:ketosteroid isomerase-like protein
MAFDERRVRLHGDATAIVSGTTRVQVVTGGRDIEVKLRFTELYVKDKGGWKMALWQSTRVPD